MLTLPVPLPPPLPPSLPSPLLVAGVRAAEPARRVQVRRGLQPADGGERSQGEEGDRAGSTQQSLTCRVSSQRAPFAVLDLRGAALSPIRLSRFAVRRPRPPTQASNIDEVRKVGMAIAKAYGSSENMVAATFVPDKFIFSVESAGGMLPEQIVASAMRVLVATLEELQAHAKELPGGS